MRNKSICLFVFLVFFVCVSAQNDAVEKALIRSIMEELVNNLETATEVNLTEEPYFVSVGEEYETVIMYVHILACDDLNEDGIPDYIIYRNSEGMLGGNANTNADYRVYIMKENGEVDKWYTILAYAPFSYNIIGEITYEDKRLTAEVMQNYRTYSGDLQESTVHFLYKDGNLYEESYLTDCEMAQMKDKRIFKSDLPDVERELNIDEHNYTEVSSEKYTTGSTSIRATICGCDNLELSFYIDTKLPSNKTFLPALYNQTILEWIHFLSENTRYRTLLNKVHNKFIEAGYPSEEFDFDNTWKCRVLQYTYDQPTHRLTFAINLKNIVNKNQLDNWDITIRRK